MSDDKSEDPDPRQTRLHPRLNPRLIGHGEAESALIAGWASGKLHHAWLIGGARGIGKATLAYRFARFLFARPVPPPAGAGLPGDLAVGEDQQAFRHMAARSLPDLLVIEPSYDLKKKVVRAEIGVDEARKTTEFFARTAVGGGWRVAIVDAADDLNPNSANALLKIIEEPPQRTVFLIVAHSPGRLLATIRSRCRRLDLLPLTTGEVEAVLSGLPDGKKKAAAKAIDTAIALSSGSPGRALELAGSAAAKAFSGFEAAMAAARHHDTEQLDAIAASLGGRASLGDYHLFASLMSDWVARRGVAEAKAGRPRLARCWAEAHAGIGHSLRETNTLNLDRRETLVRAFSTLAAIDASARDNP
jgi:DNA polymerase-3 subunit delta'